MEPLEIWLQNCKESEPLEIDVTPEDVIYDSIVQHGELVLDCVRITDGDSEVNLRFSKKVLEGMLAKLNDAMERE